MQIVQVSPLHNRLVAKVCLRRRVLDEGTVPRLVQGLLVILQLGFDVVRLPIEVIWLSLAAAELRCRWICW